MFDDEFNDYLEENSPLQELLREKLINIYREKNIEELRTIIIEVEMKNLSLLKEIENLKFNLMKIKQELIDAKNSQKLINKNNLNNIENFNQFYVDNFNKDLRMDNEDLIKKELSIKYDENEYEFNELFNNSNNFDELKINPKILNKYVDNNDMKNFIYEISNEMKNIISNNYNNKNNIIYNNNNNYDSNDNLGIKMQEIKNYLRDFKNLKFNSNNFNNFSNINNNKQYKIPYKNNNKNFSPKNNSNFIKINQNNNNNNFNEKEFENYSYSQLNSLNSINSQQINNSKEQIHSKQNSQISNNSNKRFNTLPNKNNLNLLNDANPFNENNKNRNN